VTAEPFAPSALEHRRADLGRFGAHEIPFLAQVDVRVDAAATSIALARETNTWVVDGDRELLWLGPDEWLVVGPAGTERAIVDEIEHALTGVQHSVVGVSAARAVFELTREDRHEMLSKGCGLDLHPRSWRRGMCAQTLLARVPVILQERDRATRVFVRPSFAGYLVDWLLDAAGVRA
jgi:sarcosine oxidase subunit gamma